MSESVPLLVHSSSVKRRCSPCHFLLIHSREAVLVLFWDLIIGIAQYVGLSVMSDDLAHVRKIELGLAFTFIVAGYLGDFLISRHKLILAGLYSLFLLVIPMLLVVSLQLVPSNDIILLIYIIFSYAVFVIVGAVRVNVLPFNIDQLIGSSSDELTAIIHWHNAGPLLGPFIITNANLLATEYRRIVWLGSIIVFVTAILVSHSLFNHYLNTTPVNTVNPVKLIVRVLCYARKHKYPENRSALTYWEEEAPSRLDLGKDKYGGPFTEEEVEDVKTVLRLLPMVIIFGLSGSLYNLYSISMDATAYGCNDLNTGMQSYFRKYIPSMLKRIGIGLTLIFIVNVLYVILAILGNYHFGETFHCLTIFDKKLSARPQSWQYFDEIIGAIVWYSNDVVSVEFILAQCPKSMRGTVIALWFSLFRLRSQFQFMLIFWPFLQYMSPDIPLGRGFYFFLTLSVLSLLVLVLFIYLAKRYKLRVREVEINIHQIAENYTIRYIEQDEEHR
uniref:Major facilitator superfamily (MFS) profile domain-containing protein n=1 Tax=Amphimedon queenslandica TaxID=400682 RepID=A0A1X7TWD4_AMPQE